MLGICPMKHHEVPKSCKQTSPRNRSHYCSTAAELLISFSSECHFTVTLCGYTSLFRNTSCISNILLVYGGGERQIPYVDLLGKVFKTAQIITFEKVSSSVNSPLNFIIYSEKKINNNHHLIHMNIL